jgi:isomerase DpgB
MSTSLIEIENRTLVRVEIDGAGFLSNELTAQLGDAADQAEDLGPPAVMLVHVAGHVDPAVLRPWPGRIDIQSVNKWERVLRRIERTGLMTVVLVEHACSALALELLLVADRRLACADFSVRYAIPGRDVWPGMALYRLSRQIGYARTRKLFLDGADITAALALELNIVDETVGHLTSGVDRIAHLLKHAPVDDFAVRRRLMQDSLSTSFDDALGAHLAACDRALRRSPAPNNEFATAQETTCAARLAPMPNS